MKIETGHWAQNGAMRPAVQHCIARGQLDSPKGNQADVVADTLLHRHGATVGAC